ncbi:MAG: hypothetical protein J6S27_07715 [Thermoguttaceae bacterium]|nr:hypothetical protein [Thermoguttaceae bacterium]
MNQKQKNDSKTVSPTRGDAPGCFLAGMIVAAVIWLVLVSIVVFAYLSGDKSSNSNEDLYLSVTFLTIVFVAVESFVWVLWQMIVYRGKRKEQIQNDSKPDSPFLDLTAIGCSGCLLGLSVIALVLGLTFAFYCFVDVLVSWRRFPYMIFGLVMGQPILSLLITIPLLILLRLFYPRNNGRGQNKNNSKTASRLDLPLYIAFAMVLIFLVFLWISIWISPAV